MKKILLFILAASALLASCEENSGQGTLSPDQASIGLNPTTTIHTRAAIDDTVFPDDRTLTVSAYNNAEGASGNYFSGASFIKTSNLWNGYKTWPQSGTLDILAVSYDNIQPISILYGDNVAESVTLVLPDNSSKQVDILHGSARNQSYAESGTPIVMRHACALLTFNAMNSTAYDAEANKGITITGITVNDAKYGGTLTVKAQSENSDWCTWSDLNEQKDVNVPDISNYHVQTASEQLSLGIGGAGVLVPEQSQTSFTVHYTIHCGKDAVGEAINNVTENTYLCGGEWTEGKKYEYTLSFSNDNVTVNPEVANWDTNPIVPVLPEKLSATYYVNSLESVTMPAAKMTAGTETMINWGDGTSEVFGTAIGGAGVKNDTVILSHTYTSVYNGNVSLYVRSGSLDFGAVATPEYAKFAVYDDSKVKVIERISGPVLPGVFTVCADPVKKVKFTRGNLMANVNAEGTKVTKWKLADNQYDEITATDAQRHCKNGWVDLFGWTAAGKYSDGVKQYGINTSENEADYYIEGKNDECCDWESLIEGGYSMLSETEWRYLLNNSTAVSTGTNIYRNQVNDKYGVILLPDGYSREPIKSSYTAEEWIVLETEGLVFLPQNTGYAKGSSIYGGDAYFYWTKTASIYTDAEGEAFAARFTSSYEPTTRTHSRSSRCHVRLVQIQ